jgi:hypothetical protein
MAVCGLNSDELSMKFEFHNLKAAELVIKKDYPNGMDKIEMDKFKVAFVVFVMGTFLAPTCKYNTVNPDFLGSLVNPDEINQYNWSAYVLDHLIQATARVQDDLHTRRDVSNITGCSLLIQVCCFIFFIGYTSTIPQKVVGDRRVGLIKFVAQACVQIYWNMHLSLSHI